MTILELSPDVEGKNKKRYKEIWEVGSGDMSL